MTESPVDPGRSDLPVAYSDPVYLAAVIDLLGAIAYGEMSAFERLSEDAKMAPGLPDKAELARMASTEFAHSAPTRSRRCRRSSRRSTPSTCVRRPRTGSRGW